MPFVEDVANHYMPQCWLTRRGLTVKTGFGSSRSAWTSAPVAARTRTENAALRIVYKDP